MVTKYDVFEILYKGRTPLKPIEVVKKLNKPKSEYKNIHRILKELEKDGFLIKAKTGFEAKKSDRYGLLYSLIYYCLRNGINYNLLIDKNLAGFIYKAFGKKEFQQKDIRINPKTFKKYIEILNRYGLLLIISRRPVKVRMFYNTLINNLLVYFGFKRLPAKDFKTNYLSEIERELALYKRLRKKNEAGYRRIVSEFEIAFVQHSLALEGNPITLPDTIKILKDKVIPKSLKTEDVDEIKNYQNAILDMLKDAHEREILTQGAILEYHRLAMSHKPDIAGRIRKIEVHIKGNPGFIVAKPYDIEPKLNRLLEKYNDFISEKTLSTKEIINFSSFFHNEFQHIHPFLDGNSRTTRLITFHLLHSKGIPILDIPFGLLDEYLSYTKGSSKRDDKKLYECLQRIILFNLKKINERLQS